MMESRTDRLLPHRAILALFAVVVGLGFAAACPRTAGAGSTDPVLAIGQLTARRIGSAAIVEVTGIFGFDDVLQVPYSLNLVVHHGASFVRFPAAAAAVSGTLAALSDGLAVSEIASLEAAGGLEPSAEIVSLEPNRLVVSLPASLANQPTISAQFYVEVPGEGSFVSNAVLIAISGGGTP